MFPKVKSVFSTSLRVAIEDSSPRRFQSKIFMLSVEVEGVVWRPLREVKDDGEKAAIIESYNRNTVMNRIRV